MVSQTTCKTIEVDGLSLFYRTAGSSTSPKILLLHGFPSSSHQYRNLIPLLAEKYHVLAPDLPGFGFTTVPAAREYAYKFSSLATTVGHFLDALSIEKFSVYIFDYGAPTALRLMLERPKAITAIISQNGNAYDEGLGAFWDPIRKYWASGAQADRDALVPALLEFGPTKWQYEYGSPHPETIAPETYHLDAALMKRPGNFDIQLDLFKDYATNLPLYPKFQEFFREKQIPVLAVWGKNDLIFIPPGAEAFKRDLPKAEVHLIDAGHFAVETHTDLIAELMLEFLDKVGA
jgi:pimeloyl-ACP methyl ester carboxylesterase